jgi:hypothetical protein
VLVAVVDLDEAAHEFEARYGLRSIPGGHHPGVGTANRIIPLGREYLELISVVDDGEAARSLRSMRVKRAVERAHTFAGWAARTNKLDLMRARLIEAGFDLPDMVSGVRAKPDGSTLRWRSQDLSREPDSVLPFVIEWDIPERLHPARSTINHPAGASGISSMVLGHPEPEYARLTLERALGRGIRREVRENDWAGLLEVRLATPNGELLVS